MRAVAEVEAFAGVTSVVHKRVGPNRDGERLARGIGSIGLTFAREHARDIDLQWNCGDSTGRAARRTHADYSPGAGRGKL